MYLINVYSSSYNKLNILLPLLNPRKQFTVKFAIYLQRAQKPARNVILRIISLGLIALSVIFRFILDKVRFGEGIEMGIIIYTVDVLATIEAGVMVLVDKIAKRCYNIYYE